MGFPLAFASLSHLRSFILYARWVGVSRVMFAVPYNVDWLSFWRWNHSIRFVVIVFNLFNEMFTHWIRYHTIVVLVDCLLSPSYQLNAFYRITDPLSYPLSIALFVLFTAVQFFLSQCTSPWKETSRSETSEIVSVAPVYKPSFTMVHGMSIVEGRDARRIESLRAKRHYRMRRKATPIQKLNLDSEMNPVLKAQRRNEKNQLWTIEFPANQATRFLQKECCLDSLRKCYFITSLKEEKKIV